MTVDLLRCRCGIPCTERATQEDMLCDTCRRGDLHIHVGSLSGTTIEPMQPLATTEPMRMTVTTSAV